MENDFSIGVIITLYNKENYIKRALLSIQNQSKKPNKVIIINDCSTDKSEKIFKENNINHINLIHNLGIGGAVQTGYKYALENNYDIAIQFDGDGQHDINYVSKIIEPIINKKSNMVIGSRFIDDSSDFKSTKMRQCGINLISFFIKLFTYGIIKV